MRSKFVLLLVLGGIAWALRAPVGGMVFYAWITLFRPQDFTYLPLPNLVPVAVAILVFSLLSGLARKKLKFCWNIGAFYLCSILFACFLSFCFSSTQAAAWEKLVQVFKILLPSILICISISSKKDLKTIIMTYAISIGIWGIQAAVHGLLRGGAVENMSIGGQMSERNGFALGVMMTWPMWYYFGLLAEKKLHKYFFFGGSFFVGLCVIVSNSRGVMLALGLLLTLNFMRKNTKRWRNLALVVFLGPALIPLIPDYAIERLQTIEVGAEQTDGSAQSRLILMKAGIDGALDHPVFGVGAGCWGLHYHNYVEAMGDGAYEPHSIWIKIAAETGFIGLGLYLFMFGRVIMTLRKIQRLSLRENNMSPYHYAGMLQLSLIGYCAAGTFSNQIFFEYMFLIIATSGAFIRLWKSGDFAAVQQENKAVRETGTPQCSVGI